MKFAWRSSLEAVNLYGCTRLAARILDLRKLGFDIDDRLVVENGKHWKQYCIKKENSK
jgi:hypothetical protein